MKNIFLQKIVSSFSRLANLAKKLSKPTAWLCLLSILGVIISCEPKPPQQSVKLPEAKSVNELSRAIYSAYLQLDPQFVKAVADAAPVRDLLTGLMQFNPQGEVVPALAKSTLSEDGKTWLIQLNEHKWSNGEPVTAQDFVNSWQRLSDPHNSSPLSHYLIYMGVKNAKGIIQGNLSPETLGITATDDQHLSIKLDKTNFDLPKMLAHIALLPTYQGKKPQPDEPFVSNGAYKIIARNKLNLTLQAVSSNVPFQKVQYHLINTAQNPDRFDIIENPLENYHYHNRELPRLCTYFYEFNFKDPLLAKKEIRQAISAMIQPTEISQDLGIPIHSALPKTMLANYRHLPAMSTEQLFRQLGINANNPLKIALTYDNKKQHADIANRMARTLGQSDLFRIHLQAVDWKQLLAKREEKSFQLIRSGWCADYNDPLLFLTPFHSASPDNKSGYANPQVDALLTQLQQGNLDNTTRNKLILDTVNLLENDVAILPLFQYQRRIAIDPNIQGVEMNNSSEVIYSKDLYRQ